ncbi:hypothetical protein OEG84_11460 [Hoeflea sp. G2-23]|uniref:Uncharacterized protein n=1 Tax=Hoeflea algicola TaxID=2983763 RepID=A0ABT3Z953_9HYPH|nr:hypothetical protein [Hoeflea algicola]MCY0148310.1 hypothetical protein [Hoeflea algicola]
MARRVTLVKLLDLLRAEARLSINPAHNAQARSSQVQLLQRLQDFYWEDFAWPHLRVKRQVPAQIGQRYYDLPADLPIDRVEGVEVFTNGAWIPLDPGISSVHYSAHNSDLDERSWPPRRWQINEDEDIEIWPVPDQNGDATTLEGYIRFTGIRALRPLVDDADRADLDSQMLSLFAAAELLAASGGKDAQVKLDRANARYLKLKSDLTPRRTINMFGVGEQPTKRRMAITSYRVAGS